MYIHLDNYIYIYICYFSTFSCAFLSMFFMNSIYENLLVFV